MAIERPYNGNTWTEARYHSFIKGALRAASRRWGPKWEVKKAARKARGIYECAGYGRKPHSVPASLPAPAGKKRRIDNSIVDHIEPVINPDVGFTTWDELIARMFVEEDGLQLLCHFCHAKKSAKERKRNVSRRQNNV